METTGATLAGGVPTGLAVSEVRGWAWAALSIVGCIASVSALVWPAGQMEENLGVPHAATLAVWAFTWVISSGLLALVAARLAFGRWLEARARVWLMLLVGGAVSAGQIAILIEWAMARYAHAFEVDHIGPTSLLFAVVAGTAVGGFAVQVAPRGGLVPPLLAVLTGAGLAGLILISNASGLQDGLAPDSVPLAMMVGATTVYVVVTVILSIRRAISA